MVEVVVGKREEGEGGSPSDFLPTLPHQLTKVQ